jgi:hypothetical protein
VGTTKKRKWVHSSQKDAARNIRVASVLNDSHQVSRLLKNSGMKQLRFIDLFAGLGGFHQMRDGSVILTVPDQPVPDGAKLG